ncbi:maleylacetoacetate isomerase [Sneathiella limimaris]|uniref:maleylacetoacetate isomerase n=1 Tax=Sneathiella limimaris TaxID=1964213 RepID=UPI00146B4A3C|nr:maleylacetoacetate isomerase [Sneathiella limimaris]
MLELFNYFRSSAAYRVRIALNLKEIEHVLTPVNLVKKEHQSPEYLKLNPQGLVPSLKLDDGRILTQSPAILNYLEKVYAEVKLLPEDPFLAASIQSWCDIIGCDIHPIDNLRVLNYLTSKLNVSEEDKLTWYAYWIEKGFAALEPQLVGSPYCAGPEVTMADLYLVPQVYNALRFKVDLTPFPKIAAIYSACNQLPAFKDAAPENQSDCPPDLKT